MQSAIGRLRARGSAKSGFGHWKAQRVTAVINFVTLVWFAFQMIAMSGAGYAAWTAWFQSPVNASLLIVLVLSVFYHVHLGFQVMVEDYVHSHASRIVALMAATVVIVILAASCVVSILMLATGA
jgi:succinate dehydrogenase / fumarate reductase, membrane anchor subunit